MMFPVSGPGLLCGSSVGMARFEKAAGTLTYLLFVLWTEFRLFAREEAFDHNSRSDGGDYRQTAGCAPSHPNPPDFSGSQGKYTQFS